MNKPRSNERGKGKKPSKTAFIHMRVYEEEKSMFNNRAKFAGMSITEFLVEAGKHFFPKGLDK